MLRHVDTGVAGPRSTRIVAALDTRPEGFDDPPQAGQAVRHPTARCSQAGEVDWALGEALAYGSLLLEGTDGAPGRPGHPAGHLLRTATPCWSTTAPAPSTPRWRPLAADQAPGSALYDSLLSEYAALGFEYGYSVVNKDALVIWEAQFGDFVNGAQIIIDQFLVAAEDKWGQTSGLVLLLPHGYEGQGPEHSSGRIERFLTLAAEDNIQVCNATTAAQFFHLLRRQMRRTVRKPLVVFTPKSLLRAKMSRSARSASSDRRLLPGGARRPGRDPDPAAVRRIVLCSGKVAYDALARRDALASQGESAPVTRATASIPSAR